MVTGGPSGYDVSYSQDARRDLRRLAPRHKVIAQLAIESLLRDPTDANPAVFEIIDDEGRTTGNYVMIWRDLAILFHFLNALVIELAAVDAGLRFSATDPS